MPIRLPQLVPTGVSPKSLRYVVKTQWDRLPGLIETDDVIRAVKPIEIYHATPELRTVESDLTDPAGRFRVRSSGDILQFQRALTAAWATAESLLELYGDGNNPLLQHQMLVTNQGGGSYLHVYLNALAAQTVAAYGGGLTAVRARAAVDATNTQNWTATLAGLAAFNAAVDVSAGAVGTFTSLVAFITTANLVAGTVTNLIHAYFQDRVGAGTLTNQYGLYIENLLGGTSNYGIYIAGAGTYAIWVDTGITRLDGELNIQGGGINHDAGNVGFFAAAPVAQQTRGATLTNNVAVGGTDDIIANFTDLATYANDAAAIRNNLYQLARVLRQHDVALRAYGLET